MQQATVTSKERITINLDQPQHRELQQLAKQHRVSMSWIGQLAITRFLEQYKQNEFQFPLELDQHTGT